MSDSAAGYSIRSYEAVIPDTLDLAERAELAMHGIVGTTDPEDEYMMWFEVFWTTRPPHLLHSGFDIRIAPKFLDDMTLLRIASGSDNYLDVEQGMAQSLMSFVSPEDGQYYARYKPETRPWHMTGRNDELIQPVDYASPLAAGILMTALAVRNDLGLTPCDDLLAVMARGLEEISIKKDDYAYYPLDTASTACPGTCPTLQN